MRLGQGRKGGLGSISGRVCLLLHVFGAIIAGDRDAWEHQTEEDLQTAEPRPAKVTIVRAGQSLSARIRRSKADREVGDAHRDPVDDCLVSRSRWP